METEILVFLLTLILFFVYLFAPLIFLVGANGLNTLLGSRDQVKDAESAVFTRANRAFNNLKETLPIALTLLILVPLQGKGNDTSALGAWIYFGARCAYLPCYMSGIPYVRTFTWATSIVGLTLVAVQLL